MQNCQGKCQPLHSKEYAKEIDKRTKLFTCIASEMSTYLEHMIFNNNNSINGGTGCFSPNYPRDGYLYDDDAGQLRLTKVLRLAYKVTVSCSQN